MFRNAYQRGFLTVFYSVGSKPLELWEVHMENGHIARLLDPDLKSMVLDIRGYNVSTAYITCPTKNRVLGISMPFMIMVVKNLKKYFTFEVTIMDDSGTRRRFRISNFQSTTQILPLSTAMPIGLAEGWNQIQFNLSEFTRRAYNKTFVEVQKIKVNANIRLRRIYFAEKLTPEEELPPEYRIFLPLPSKVKGKKTSLEGSKTNVIKEPSKTAMKMVSQASITALPQPEAQQPPADVPEEAPPADAGPPAEETPTTGDAVTPDEVPLEEVVAEGEATSGKGEGEGEGDTTPGKTETEGEATPVADEGAEAQPVAEGDEAQPVAEEAAQPPAE